MKHTCETCGWWGRSDDTYESLHRCTCVEYGLSTRADWRCNHHTALEAQRTRLDIAARMMPMLVHRCRDNYYNCTVLSDEQNAEELLKMADALIAAAGEGE